MAMTAQGLMLSLAGVSVCASMMAFHARSKRADSDQGAARSAQRLPNAWRSASACRQRFMRWVTRVLIGTASTTPEPMATPSDFYSGVEF